MDWTTIGLDALTLILDVLTLFIVIASFKAVRDNHKQSQAAIDAMNKQIVVSERQAQEALYNQHKPVIVPLSRLSGLAKLQFTMQNKGTGIALNTWGILTNVSSGTLYRFENAYFLVPDKAEAISLFEVTNALDFIFPNREFYGYSIYPQADNTRLHAEMRLMVTFRDIFANKYLIIFDWSSFGWRQFEILTKIEQGLDEYLVEKWSIAQPTTTGS